MAVEIERKFLVISDGWKAHVTSRHRLVEGIASFGSGKVRIRRDEERAWVTFKGPRNGLSRPEFEYSIPRHDAEEMLNTLSPSIVISKVRHLVRVGQMVWVVDVHERPISGLVTTEIELATADQSVELPEWVGSEITGT